MRKCIVQWHYSADGSRSWRCGEFLMSRGVEFRETSERCYHYRCPGRLEIPPPKPIQILESKSNPVDCPLQETPKPLKNSKYCAKFKCRRKVPSHRFKFCSENCGNAERQRQFKARKKAEKNKNVPN